VIIVAFFVGLFVGVVFGMAAQWVMDLREFERDR
jgi:hypothetical protein